MKKNILLLFLLALSGLAFGQDLRHYQYMYVATLASSDTSADSLNHESVRNLYPFTQPLQSRYAPIPIYWDRYPGLRYAQPSQSSETSQLKWYNRLYNKVFQENLVIINRPGYLITADPLFDTEPGRETIAGQNTWINTRGVQIYGRLEMGERIKGVEGVEGVEGV